MKNIKPIKYKEAPKYPGIVKDMAFIVSNNILAQDIVTTIKKSGGRLLTDVTIFDVYTGDKIDNDKKSIAFSLTFEDSTRTLTDEEVMNVFNKIIDGTYKGGQVVVNTLASGGVGIADSTDKNVPKDILDYVEKEAQKIKDGEITVPENAEEYKEIFGE